MAWAINRTPFGRIPVYSNISSFEQVFLRHYDHVRALPDVNEVITAPKLGPLNPTEKVNIRRACKVSASNFRGLGIESRHICLYTAVSHHDVM